MNTGTAASTASPAWLRRRPYISRSSDRKNLGENAATGRRTTVAPCGTSATDIEPLPGQRDEDVLQRRPADPEAGHGDAGVDAGRDDLLRCHVADRPGRAGTCRVHAGQPELAHHPG